MTEVETSSDVFAAHTDVISVISLIHFFASGRHEWRLDRETADAVEKFVSKNIPRLSSSICALAQKAWTAQTAWTASVYPRPPSPMYFVTAENIEKSLVDLARPGVIVVEDLVSDRVFIEAVVNAAKDSRVERALISGWLEVRHAGGGGRVVAVAKDEAEKFQGPMRVAAIIDSDSLFPGHQTQSHANATRLVTLGIYCHVLKHREIENYIPNRALSAIRPYTKTHKRLLALKTFTKVQRAHFDFKKGFGSRGERFERLPREHQNLYDGVSLQVMNELEDGFGENVIECLQKVSSLISMQDFSSVGEGVRQELDDLLSMIQSLI